MELNFSFFNNKITLSHDAIINTIYNIVKKTLDWTTDIKIIANNNTIDISIKTNNYLQKLNVLEVTNEIERLIYFNLNKKDLNIIIRTI